MSTSKYLWLFVCPLLIAACGGTDPNFGLGEPIVVYDGQFVQGLLPESSLSTPTTTSPVSDVPAPFERSAGIVYQGNASRDAAAVGIQIGELGSGYYLIPTGPTNAQDPRLLTWSFTMNLQSALPPGRHKLHTVAFDAEGNPGPRSEMTFCVRSLRPDNGNSCFTEISPPALVVSLEWDRPADLDLILVLPDGSRINAQRPSGTTNENDTSGGQLTLDSNANCLFDGRQREDIVFAEFPRAGTYAAYVNLFRACKEESVTYQVSRHTRSRIEGGFRVQSRDIGAGSLTKAQANAGTSIGTFVGEITIQ